MADNFMLKAILSAVDKMSPTFKKVQTNARATRKYLLDVSSAATSLGHKIGLPVGLLSAAAAGLSFHGLKESIEGFTEFAAETSKAAFATGQSVEQIQRLQYVSEQSEVPIDVLTSSMGKFNKSIGLAAAGKNKDLAGLLKKLHINMRDSNGQIRDGVSLLPELSDAFVRQTSAVNRARMGSTLYGKAWQGMAPLLMEGSAAIAENFERFDHLKGFISQDDIRAGKAFGDQLKDVSMVTRGFQYTIATQLIPTLRPMIEQFIEWARANRELIAQQVKAVVIEIIEAIKKFDWKGFVQDIMSIARGFASFVEFVGGAKNALILFALVSNAQALVSVYGLIASVTRLVWWMGTLAIASRGTALTVAQSMATALTSASAASLTGSMLSLTKNAGLLGAAALVGYGIGTVINKAIEGTKVGDFIGSAIAHTLAFFGNEEAKAAVKQMDGQDSTSTNSSPIGRGNQTGHGVSGNRPIVTGTTTARTQVDVNFKNAPTGMRVEQVHTGRGATVNHKVGYRTAAIGMP